MEEVSRSKLGLGGGGRVVDARFNVAKKKKDEISIKTKNKGRGRSEVFGIKEGGLVARENVGGAHPAGVDHPDGAAVGRLGAAFVATGKGGGAARNTTMTATTGKTKMGNFEWEPNGSFNVMKGRARVSPTAESIPPNDEGYYSHSYGQLAIHKEMLQVCTVFGKVGFMYFSPEMNEIHNIIGCAPGRSENRHISQSHHEE